MQTVIAKGPASELATFAFHATAPTAPPKAIKPLPAHEVVARRYVSCGIALDAAVVFDGAGEAIPETLYMHRKESLPKYTFKKLPELAGRNVVMLHNAGWRNHYHWLIQSMFAQYLYAPHVKPEDIFIFPIPLQARMNHIAFCGIPEAQTVFMHKMAAFHADSVTVVDACYSRFSGNQTPLLKGFASRLSQHAVAPLLPIKKLYVSRRDSSNRVMANEAEIEAHLAQRGFQSVLLSKYSFPEQIGLFRGADVIVAAHGAGLANVIFCRPGTHIVELTPASYITPCFLRIGQVLDLQWEMMAFEAEPAPRQQDITWRVDPAVLLASL